MPVANSWDSALTDTSTSALTSSLEDTSLNSFSNSNAYLSALNPLQQNTNSYLNALTPLQQNSNSYLGTQNTLPQNNSLIDLLKQMFPLKTGDETTDLSSTQTPTDLMTNYLSTPLHQGVQNGLNAVLGSTPSYATSFNPNQIDLIEKQNNSLKNNFNFDDIYYSKRDENGKISYIGTDIHEGGYSNRENDEGGPTNYGITQSSLNEYNEWANPLKWNNELPSNVKSLTPLQAKQIMDEMYYQRYHINKLNNLKIAKNIFDSEINQGTRAVNYLSDAFNKMKGTQFSDRITISQNLADAVNSLSDEEATKLNDLIVHNRMNGYFNRVDAVPQKNINNLKGWYNRLKTYYSDPDIFEKIYKSRLDEYLNNKYPHYYNKK